MNTHADKTQEHKRQFVANAISQKSNGDESTFQFVDNRPEAVTQKILQEIANNDPQKKQAAQLQVMADNYSSQQQQSIQKKENKTGLPDTLKTGIENLSGYSMDDVKVHYNSDKPAQLQAHAYAQGTDIHLASGQEKHLPHEAWHIVQQKQGRVKPTIQMKHKVNVNDDVGLEKEADVMGVKALQVDQYKKDSFNNKIALSPVNNIVQRNDDEITLGNFPINPIHFHVTDLGDERIQEIIEKLAVKENLKEDVVKTKCMSDDQQWIGRGWCDKIFGVYKGSGKSFNYKHRTNGNTWNHVADYSDGIINDSSWKQFFTKSLDITRNHPPIFKGTADELRNFGLPTEDVESYLDMFGIGDNSKPDSLKYHYNVDRQHELRIKEDQNLKNLKILNKSKNRTK